MSSRNRAAGEPGIDEERRGQAAGPGVQSCATDCVYEVELAPPPLVTTKDVKDLTLQPPDKNAPAVVILDTGVATGQPLLKGALLTATTTGPEISSPVCRNCQKVPPAAGARPGPASCARDVS